MAGPVHIQENSARHWMLRLLGTVLVAGGLLWVATKGSNGLISDVTTALVLAVAAMSLNLVLGYTGMISIGHSAFYGIGTYSTRAS